jgi:hypothetical protein
MPVRGSRTRDELGAACEAKCDAYADAVGSADAATPLDVNIACFRYAHPSHDKDSVFDGDVFLRCYDVYLRYAPSRPPATALCPLDCGLLIDTWQEAKRPIADLPGATAKCESACARFGDTPAQGDAGSLVHSTTFSGAIQSCLLYLRHRNADLDELVGCVTQEPELEPPPRPSPPLEVSAPGTANSMVSALLVLVSAGLLLAAGARCLRALRDALRERGTRSRMIRSGADAKLGAEAILRGTLVDHGQGASRDLEQAIAATGHASLRDDSGRVFRIDGETPRHVLAPGAGAGEAWLYVAGVLERGDAPVSGPADYREPAVAPVLVRPLESGKVIVSDRSPRRSATRRAAIASAAVALVLLGAGSYAYLFTGYFTHLFGARAAKAVVVSSTRTADGASLVVRSTTGDSTFTGRVAGNALEGTEVWCLEQRGVIVALGSHAREEVVRLLSGLGLSVLVLVLVLLIPLKRAVPWR